METMRLLGKRLVRISEEDHRELLGYNTHPLRNRGHICFTSGFTSYVCFPGFTVVGLKPELTQVNWLSHFTICGNRSKRASCILEFKDGSYWKAAKHRPGKCPFCDYKEVRLHDRRRP